MDKKDYSKNVEAERICGKRAGGTPIDLPCELDYACPICHRTCKFCSGEKKTSKLIQHWDETLEFSEYDYFMWCPNCNLDIPSLFCLRANTKRKVEIYTNRFLDLVKELKGLKR